MSNSELSQLPEWLLPVMIALAIWSLFWKAAALWQAARSKKLNWFIVMSIINTAGILEIIYLFGVEKVRTNKLFK